QSSVSRVVILSTQPQVPAKPNYLVQPVWVSGIGETRYGHIKLFSSRLVGNNLYGILPIRIGIEKIQPYSILSSACWQAQGTQDSIAIGASETRLCPHRGSKST